MDRYSRQILFSSIGEIGQKKIRNSHILIIGAGALGSASAEMLTRAGIGKITMADRDYVEWSNLQRQQLYTEEDAENRLPKAIAAKQRLKAVNSEVEIESVVEDITAQSIELLLKDHCDLIIDATDNFETRLLINDAAQKYKIPWIYGGCVGSYGLTFTILPGETPCLACMLNHLPADGMTCDTVGIISPAVQMVASYQTAEALKWITGNHEQMRRKLLSFDVWTNQFTQISIDSMKKKDCPSCGESPTYPNLSFENMTKTAVLCGRDTVQIRPGQKREISFELLEKQLNGNGSVREIQANPYLISFKVDEYRFVVFRDGRILLHGIKDVVKAKTLYHQYLG
ncbi:thiazole biosynthesis adenylyltransferase ThiF [Metabacillus arenae]|uniref:Thiazole biosynthesis adenylyltransferase ThiF n=1 Tax=Metabacillus arenae TaxID=2771434 RepID=A0A926NQ52_9BACI|nr:thiazole biosynthesis adenylyltransferase ThiF [Metabacillus arenae]MBD1381891.1 thiazole biosynthesis adenylyltransferase ThiF [Metabacillus arenae]